MLSVSGNNLCHTISVVNEGSLRDTSPTMLDIDIGGAEGYLRYTSDANHIAYAWHDKRSPTSVRIPARCPATFNMSNLLV